MIGLVALGHSPRPDHEEVYDSIAPGTARQLQGALDPLSCDEARGLENKEGVSPLVCLLNDGSTVEIPLPILFPYIEACVESLAKKGAHLAVVLCSGGFPEFNCSIPVFLPGNIVPATVNAISPQGKIGIISPNAAQEPAARAHWEKAIGRPVISAVVSPYAGTGFEEAAALFKAEACDIVAIDCMGFKEEHRDRLITDSGCRVMLPKTLVARVAKEVVESSPKK